ncbi:MAG: hypothetical protein HPY57_15910 [Ignavibacteria bacterium]|nr:hypothetical protein [Ignavibacteria bacterium]
MKFLFDYENFISEAKKSVTTLSLFKKDVENIINDMFLVAKKPKYEYDDEGFPISVEFEVIYNDWFCKYDDELKNDFSEGVLKKRDFEPSLVYLSKNQEGKDKDKDKNKYTIKFKIKKLKVDKEAIKKREEKKRSEQFERDSDDHPFEEDDEYEMSEEEMAKQAEKAAKLKEKKNKSFLNEGHMSNIHIIANEAGSFENFKIEMMKEYPDLFRKSIGEQDKLNDWLKTVYEESIEDEGITEKKKDCGCGKPKAIENEKCEKCGKKECECGESKKCECGKPDCIKCNESLNEGFLGKIAKILSRKEYDKAVNHVLDNCDGECTKEKVKDALKGMLFDKLTKKKLEEDGKLMASLIDEIYKDVKKKLETKESFGSKEWQEKYGVSIKEEKEEACLKCIVNETLKIKKVDEIETLNDVFNKVYEENKVVENLNTIKKFKE